MAKPSKPEIEIAAQMGASGEFSLAEKRAYMKEVYFDEKLKYQGIRSIYLWFMLGASIAWAIFLAGSTLLLLWGYKETPPQIKLALITTATTFFSVNAFLICRWLMPTHNKDESDSLAGETIKRTKEFAENSGS